MFLLEETFYAFSSLARTAAGSRIDRVLRREVRSLSLRRLSVSQLDDPAIVDDLARTSDLDQKWVRSVGSGATGQLLLLFRCHRLSAAPSSGPSPIGLSGRSC
jgi:hypothetical protein